MNTSARINIVLGLVAATVTTAAWLYAGPLTPPAGPIASTNKTLQEVEPRIAINATNTPGDADSVFKITQPGSYYLTGNVGGVAARYGIEIASSNVSIDLMGYSLLGVAGSLDGISNVAASVSNVRVENGIATGWGGDGIQLSLGESFLVRGVTASSCGGVGIYVGDDSSVESCVATGCTTGFLTTGHGTIGSCVASGNTAEGFYMGSPAATVRGCVASSNTGVGIRLLGDGSVADCTSNGNLGGILTGIGATVANSSARDNTGDGISVSSACIVSGCSAYSNGDDGIVSVSTSTQISNCTVSFNSGDGIEVPGNCTILNNNCDANGVGAGIGSGVKVTGTDCRVDGNTLMRNDIGLDVQLGANFIVRNAAASNTTNYQLVVNNKVGTIVSAPNSAAIAGAAGGAGVGSTDPWANFSY